MCRPQEVFATNGPVQLHKALARVVAALLQVDGLLVGANWFAMLEHVTSWLRCGSPPTIRQVLAFYMHMGGGGVWQIPVARARAQASLRSPL